MNQPKPYILAALGVATLSLGGCGATSDQIMRQAAGYECSETTSMIGGLICSENDRPEVQVSRYCYETLGVTNCFDRPDPDRKNKPLGTPDY